eukprot:344960-Pyramimonas_sp.AAC.1
MVPRSSSFAGPSVTLLREPVPCVGVALAGGCDARRGSLQVRRLIKPAYAIVSPRPLARGL